jgi:hypothetical protein
VFDNRSSSSNLGILAKEFPSMLGLKVLLGGHAGSGNGATFEVAFGFGFFLTFGLVAGFFVALGFAVGFLVTVGFAVGFFVTVGLAVGFFVGAGEFVAALEDNTAAGVISENIRTARRRRLITVPLKFSD